MVAFFQIALLSPMHCFCDKLYCSCLRSNLIELYCCVIIISAILSLICAIVDAETNDNVLWVEELQDWRSACSIVSSQS